MVRKHGSTVTTKREKQNIVAARHGRDSWLHRHVSRSLLRATKKKLHTLLVKPYVGISTFLFFFHVEGLWRAKINFSKNRKFDASVYNWGNLNNLLIWLFALGPAVHCPIESYTDFAIFFLNKYPM
jgi:hypothetical protein